MSDDAHVKSMEYSCQPQSAEPRWFMLRQPRIHGMATYEWNILTGTCWYSEEWENIVQCPYDWTIPSNQEWWTERLHPEDMALMERAILAIHAGFVDRYELTCRLKRPDGTWRRVFFRSIVTEKTSEGAPWLLSGVCVDLTEMLPGGQELPRPKSLSELDYHSMLENSPDLFVRFDGDLKPVYANPAVSKYLGGRRKDLVYNERQVNRRLAGDYRELFQKNVERVFREKALVRQEMTLSMTDGSEVAGECSFWPEFDGKGNVRFAMLQFRDITDKRRTEQRAALNEERLEALYRLTMMEKAPESEVLHFVLDSVQKLTHSRSSFFFIPEEERSDRGFLLWSSDHYEDLGQQYLPQDHLPEDLIVQMTGPGGDRVYRSIRNSRPDGRPLYIVFDGQMEVMRGIIAPGMEDNRLVCVAGVCNKDSDYDESDLQQLETFINSAWLILRRRRFVRELQQAKDDAEAANKAKNAFLANVSHELRTPLNGVLSMLQLIDSLPLAREQREFLQTAQASGKALLRIISDILDYSGMESGKMPLAVDVFDFQATVRSALKMFVDAAASKGIEFLYEIDPDIPRALLGDEARVRQILFNVVGNALKFTAEGSIAVSCRLLPESESGTVRVAIEVTDTGIGIPRDKLATIFDAFSQVESSHRRKYAGTGLGLSIVKHLATMMGGSVSASSEPGVGTTIRSVLGFDRPAGGKQPAVPKRAIEIFPAEPLDILVAEDDTVGSMAIRAFLRRRGHRVVCVEDGDRALEALQVYPFHCLFTDITMPAMDGLELVRHIRGGMAGAFVPTEETRNRVREVFPDAALDTRPWDPAIAVIAVSAHSMIGDRERFIEQGMNYYIAKPIDKDELDEALAFVAQRLGKA